MKKVFLYIGLLALPCVALGAAQKKQAAIQNGTNVRARVTATGVYDQKCYDAYYGCVDQFCISDNADGGSCMCSNNYSKYESELEEIQQILDRAEKIGTIEVEKIELGAKADIVFAGKRQYDEKGNVVSLKDLEQQEQKKNKRAEVLALFDQPLTFDLEEDEEDEDSIANKHGAALFAAADKVCRDQMESDCTKDLKFLRQLYQRQIESDCRGFANAITQQRNEANSKLNDADKAVRTALKNSFDEANKYNEGECMVEFKNCMQKPEACGANWENCVSTVASENMQNEKVTDVSGKKVATVRAYKISGSVMEMLEAKRNICERVLDSCMAVRDLVWDDFLREAAPTLKTAELRAESNLRQSCLDNVTNCLHRACKENIDGTGKATMDACLADPDMAKAFCKVQIDPCERMAGANFWNYVQSRLAAMRVDVCTQEVKDCFTDESRCGPDFMNCVGMDYTFIKEMCPLDKLVVCKKYKKENKESFSMDDLDDIIQGLYLNIDNKALANCQKLVEDKMMEICGSTTDCNRFASDELMGTNSLNMQKTNNLYRITGMISFGSIKVGDGETVKDGDKTLAVGEVGVDEYIQNVESMKGNGRVPNKKGIVESIKMELNNIAGKVNSVIEMIELDPKIQFCVNGRDLTQITGPDSERTMTKARFPNLLYQIKMQIAIAALRQAQSNYATKYNELLAKATKDASADVAQYLCQMLPVSGGAPVGAVNEETGLTEPYAISYDVVRGLNNNLLAQGGRGTEMVTGNAHVDVSSGEKSEDGVSKVGRVIGAIASLGLSEGLRTASNSGIPSYDIPGGKRDMWSTFNRETRVCRLCSSTVTKSCASTYKNGLFGIGRKTELNCTESDPVEKCDDIEM